VALRIALDAMGGDFGADIIVPAAIDSLALHPELELILVGDAAVLADKLKTFPVNQRISVVHASQKVDMDEAPSHALRFKKDSSMRVAINLIKENQADACVSAGNTGALMATARYVLKTLPNIDRPAICTALPTMTGHCHMLDLGANIDSTAHQLFQFAVMGSELTSAIDGLSAPKVGLLNIGQEEIKGNEQVKETAQLLAKSDLNYIGFVEGDDIYKGVVDVVVCDGFVGNVSIKTSEGVAKMIGFYLKKSFNRHWFSRLAGLIAMPVLKQFKDQIDPRHYNGASLLGLRGIVVKSHGSADRLAFRHAIKEAVLEVEKNVPARISNHLGRNLNKGG
jgi:glycerol-3-phosphate acyltransferase PlsX